MRTISITKNSVFFFLFLMVSCFTFAQKEPQLSDPEIASVAVVANQIDIKYAEIALNNNELYETIVKHRYRFTRIGGVNYNLHQPQTINPLPIPEIIEDWKADYKTMQEQMIYVVSPSFEEIIYELTSLKNKINKFKWKMESQFPIPIPNE